MLANQNGIGTTILLFLDVVILFNSYIQFNKHNFKRVMVTIAFFFLFLSLFIELSVNRDLTQLVAYVIVFFLLFNSQLNLIGT